MGSEEKLKFERELYDARVHHGHCGLFPEGEDPAVIEVKAQVSGNQRNGCLLEFKELCMDKKGRWYPFPPLRLAASLSPTGHAGLTLGDYRKSIRSKT